MKPFFCDALLLACLFGITGVALNGCTSGHPAEPGAKEPRAESDVNEIRRLLDQLKSIPVAGPTGGPYMGIDGNDVTDAIISTGPSAVPYLVREIDNSGWDETVYIVFCLRELKAKGAIPRIMQLKDEIESGKRFQNVGKNLTLEMQIQFYLREVAEPAASPRGRAFYALTREIDLASTSSGISGGRCLDLLGPPDLWKVDPDGTTLLKYYFLQNDKESEVVIEVDKGGEKVLSVGYARVAHAGAAESGFHR